MGGRTRFRRDVIAAAIESVANEWELRGASKRRASETPRPAVVVNVDVVVVVAVCALVVAHVSAPNSRVPPRFRQLARAAWNVAR